MVAQFVSMAFRNLGIERVLEELEDWLGKPPGKMYKVPIGFFLLPVIEYEKQDMG